MSDSENKPEKVGAQDNALLSAELTCLKRDFRLFKQIFLQSREAILITDPQNRIVDVNHAFEKLSGYGLDEVKGKDPRILASGRTSSNVYRQMWQDLESQGVWQGELWDQHKDGHFYPKWSTIFRVCDDAGQLVNYVASFVDTSESKAAQAEIMYLAQYDTLTRLPNRATLLKRLGREIEQAARNEEILAVVLLDLDGFKDLNDAVGHEAGDRLLVQVAQRIKSCLGPGELVARHGGDEFVVVVTGTDDINQIINVVEKIQNTLDISYDISNFQYQVSVSMGIALFPDDGLSVEELIKHADVAMYQAKKQGKNSYRFFDAEENRRLYERFNLVHEMKKGLDNEEFMLYFQPKIGVESGRVSGVEALLRWHRADDSWVSPGVFIPIAEESGFILQLGDWVLQQACKQLKVFYEHGLEDVPISVNLSAVQFGQKDLAKCLADLIAVEAFEPQRLELEITESVTMSDPQTATETMMVLREIGLNLSLDDFGAGYSSLTYLKRFPVSTLKIDRSFVKDIETDHNDAAICSATIALAHSMGLQVVAEGVETEPQLRYLRQLGCDVIQGFYYSKPLPADQVIAFIKQHNQQENT